MSSCITVHVDPVLGKSLYNKTHMRVRRAKNEEFLKLSRGPDGRGGNTREAAQGARIKAWSFKSSEPPYELSPFGLALCATSSCLLLPFIQQIGQRQLDNIELKINR